MKQSGQKGAPASGFYFEETHDDAVLLRFRQKSILNPPVAVLFCRSIFKEDNVAEANSGAGKLTARADNWFNGAR